MKKFLVLSSWSRKAIGSMLIMAFTFVGCDDSSSASAGPNDETGVESSSSVEQGSSSSEKAKSSSSDTRSDANQSSSSEKTGKSSSSSVEVQSSSNETSEKSSSSANDASSSSVKSESSSSVTSSSSIEEPKSSSSEIESCSSSSEDKVNCSALLEGETGWNWDVPKECRFNPDIDYGTMTDERDGKVYRTVKIGDQIWMAENLNFDPGQGGSGEDKYDWSWCYDNEPKNCDVAGRYYTWAAAIDSVKLANDEDNPKECGYGEECGFALADSATLVQGVCPTGWHLPSMEEWQALVVAVDANITEFSNTNAAGKVFKSQSGWDNNGNGTDAFGFSALPAGMRRYNGDFKYEGEKAYFWSTEDNSSNAYYMYLFYDTKFAGLNHNFKYYAMSVRCVKD